VDFDVPPDLQSQFDSIQPEGVRVLKARVLSHLESGKSVEEVIRGLVEVGWSEPFATWIVTEISNQRGKEPELPITGYDRSRLYPGALPTSTEVPPEVAAADRFVGSLFLVWLVVQLILVGVQRFNAASDGAPGVTYVPMFLGIACVRPLFLSKRSGYWATGIYSACLAALIVFGSGFRDAGFAFALPYLGAAIYCLIRLTSRPTGTQAYTASASPTTPATHGPWVKPAYVVATVVGLILIGAFSIPQLGGTGSSTPPTEQSGTLADKDREAEIQEMDRIGREAGKGSLNLKTMPPPKTQAGRQFYDIVLKLGELNEKRDKQVDAFSMQEDLDNGKLGGTEFAEKATAHIETFRRDSVAFFEEHKKYSNDIANLLGEYGAPVGYLKEIAAGVQSLKAPLLTYVDLGLKYVAFAKAKRTHKLAKEGPLELSVPDNETLLSIFNRIGKSADDLAAKASVIEKSQGSNLDPSPTAGH
jgi:hypothetical protein